MSNQTLRGRVEGSQEDLHVISTIACYAITLPWRGSRRFHNVPGSTETR